MAAGADVMAVIHDWAAMIALDGVLDRGYTLGRRPGRAIPHGDAEASSVDAEPAVVREVGRAAERLGLRSLPQAERLRLKASEITSIAFDGSRAFPVRPIQQVDRPESARHGGDGASRSRGRRPRPRHRARGEGPARRRDAQLPDPVRPRPRSRVRVRPGLDEPRRSWRSLAGSLRRQRE